MGGAELAAMAWPFVQAGGVILILFIAWKAWRLAPFKNRYGGCPNPFGEPPEMPRHFLWSFLPEGFDITTIEDNCGIYRFVSRKTQ